MEWLKKKIQVLTRVIAHCIGADCWVSESVWNVTPRSQNKFDGSTDFERTCFRLNCLNDEYELCQAERNERAQKEIQNKQKHWRTRVQSSSRTHIHTFMILRFSFRFVLFLHRCTFSIAGNTAAAFPSTPSSTSGIRCRSAYIISVWIYCVVGCFYDRRFARSHSIYATQNFPRAPVTPARLAHNATICNSCIQYSILHR